MADYQLPTRYTPDRLDYAVDWSDWLGDEESLTGVSVTVTGDLDVSDITHNATSMIFWLTGGTASFQTVAITATTDHSPPRVREIKASIICNS
jgi:hypothetical protein